MQGTLPVTAIAMEGSDPTFDIPLTPRDARNVKVFTNASSNMRACKIT
jgi:hypothetical protein